MVEVAFAGRAGAGGGAAGDVPGDDEVFEAFRGAVEARRANSARIRRERKIGHAQIRRREKLGIRRDRPKVALSDGIARRIEKDEGLFHEKRP